MYNKYNIDRILVFAAAFLAAGIFLANYNMLWAIGMTAVLAVVSILLRQKRFFICTGVFAAAVLLICSILSEEQLGEYIKICDSLGISALVEIHDEKEAGMAVRAGARIIGVNNRNLKDFTVDTANSKKLRDLIPDDIIFVSESGVKSTDDIRAIREIGADAVLIGETLMRADDKKAKLDELRAG